MDLTRGPWCSLWTKLLCDVVTSPVRTTRASHDVPGTQHVHSTSYSRRSRCSQKFWTCSKLFCSSYEGTTCSRCATMYADFTKSWIRPEGDPTRAWELLEDRTGHRESVKGVACMFVAQCYFFQGNEFYWKCRCKWRKNKASLEK